MSGGTRPYAAGMAYRGDVIRLATIGTSTITERFADAAARTDGIEVAAVFSRSRDRAAAFAARIAPAAEPADDLDALLASGRIDAVYVGSPNGAHAAQARAAIAAGVHVFLEKPATPTAVEFADLVAAARAAGVVVFEGMRNVYDPGMQTVRDLLGEIGQVRLVSFAQCQRSARYDLVLAGQTPNIFDPALAGGALTDLGVYPLSAAVDLFGAPGAVTGALVPIATGADGAGAAVLAYPGFAAQIAFSKIGISGRPSEIQGETGTLTIDEITQPRRVALTRLDGTTDERVIDADANNMVYEVERFARLIRGEADAAADQDRTLAVLGIIDRLRAAASAG